MGTMAMPKQQVHQEIQQMFGRVPEWVQKVPDHALPGLWVQFRDFYFNEETKLSQKQKDLIGLGVAAATHCRYCALFHTESARVAGATDEEIAEASMMASVTMMASTFINGMQIDYERFRRETTEIIQFVKQQMQQQGKGPQAQQRPNARV
jgi:AhpD family alkylhydroperoxidase